MKRTINIILFVILILLLLFLLWLILVPLADDAEDMPEETIETMYLRVQSIEDGYPLVSTNGGGVIKHTGFHLLYNEEHEQPDWVCYMLTREQTVTEPADRSDNFKIDPDVPTKSATPDDYAKTGYDRGHLAPAADMSWSEKTMDESFYMSNISPQKPEFNRGIWKKLENKVRHWASQNDTIYVVTGPLLKQIETTIGENEVSVPKYFYKVILDISWNGGYKAIGFIVENTKSTQSVFSYAVSIDYIEQVSGFDFFPAFQDKAIENLEAKVDTMLWK